MTRKRPAAPGTRARLYTVCAVGAFAIAALALTATAGGTPATTAARYQISLTTIPNPITVGQPATFAGTVSPAPPREPVRVSLWRRTRFGGWVLLSVSRENAPTGAFSITRTFGAASRHAPAMLRICLPPRRAYGVRTCTQFAVTIQPRRPRPADRHAARERRRQKREEARMRAAEKNRRHKEERAQKQANAREKHNRHKEAASERKETRRQKEAHAREERRRRREEAHRRRKERRAGR